MVFIGSPPVSSTRSDVIRLPAMIVPVRCIGATETSQRTDVDQQAQRLEELALRFINLLGGSNLECSSPSPIPESDVTECCRRLVHVEGLLLSAARECDERHRRHAVELERALSRASAAETALAQREVETERRLNALRDQVHLTDRQLAETQQELLGTREAHAVCVAEQHLERQKQEEMISILHRSAEKLKLVTTNQMRDSVGCREWKAERQRLRQRTSDLQQEVTEARERALLTDRRLLAASEHVAALRAAFLQYVPTLESAARGRSSVVGLRCPPPDEDLSSMCSDDPTETSTEYYSPTSLEVRRADQKPAVSVCLADLLPGSVSETRSMCVRGDMPQAPPDEASGYGPTSKTLRAVSVDALLQQALDAHQTWRRRARADREALHEVKAAIGAACADGETESSTWSETLARQLAMAEEKMGHLASQMDEHVGTLVGIVSQVERRAAQREAELTADLSHKLSEAAKGELEREQIFRMVTTDLGGMHTTLTSQLELLRTRRKRELGPLRSQMERCLLPDHGAPLSINRSAVSNETLGDSAEIAFDGLGVSTGMLKVS
mmetsp:Transcript_13798/g.37784  ORF Transcript_13798/g.37784 Transcript_13798/m.37784 type:complete len:557 (-) Transcript_13798:346-2016(-)